MPVSSTPPFVPRAHPDATGYPFGPNAPAAPSDAAYLDACVSDVSQPPTFVQAACVPTTLPALRVRQRRHLKRFFSAQPRARHSALRGVLTTLRRMEGLHSTSACLLGAAVLQRLGRVAPASLVEALHVIPQGIRRRALQRCASLPPPLTLFALQHAEVLEALQASDHGLHPQRVAALQAYGPQTLARLRLACRLPKLATCSFAARWHAILALRHIEVADGEAFLLFVRKVTDSNATLDDCLAVPLVAELTAQCVAQAASVAPAQRGIYVRLTALLQQQRQLGLPMSAYRARVLEATSIVLRGPPTQGTALPTLAAIASDAVAPYLVAADHATPRQMVRCAPSVFYSQAFCLRADLEVMCQVLACLTTSNSFAQRTRCRELLLQLAALSPSDLVELAATLKLRPVVRSLHHDVRPPCASLTQLKAALLRPNIASTTRAAAVRRFLLEPPGRADLTAACTEATAICSRYLSELVRYAPITKCLARWQDLRASGLLDDRRANTLVSQPICRLAALQDDGRSASAARACARVMAWQLNPSLTQELLLFAASEDAAAAETLFAEATPHGVAELFAALSPLPLSKGARQTALQVLRAPAAWRIDYVQACLALVASDVPLPIVGRLVEVLPALAAPGCFGYAISSALRSEERLPQLHAYRTNKPLTAWLAAVSIYGEPLASQDIWIAVCLEILALQIPDAHTASVVEMLHQLPTLQRITLWRVAQKACLVQTTLAQDQSISEALKELLRAAEPARMDAALAFTQISLLPIGSAFKCRLRRALQNVAQGQLCASLAAWREQGLLRLCYDYPPESSHQRAQAVALTAFFSLAPAYRRDHVVACEQALQLRTDDDLVHDLVLQLVSDTAAGTRQARMRDFLLLRSSLPENVMWAGRLARASAAIQTLLDMVGAPSEQDEADLVEFVKQCDSLEALQAIRAGATEATHAKRVVETLGTKGAAAANYHDVADLALVFLVWRAIQRYAPQAVSPADVSCDQTSMRLGLARGLAQCIEDNGSLVCVYGIQQRVLTPLQGYYPFTIDVLAPSPQVLLCLLGQQETQGGKVSLTADNSHLFASRARAQAAEVYDGNPAAYAIFEQELQGYLAYL